MVQFNDYKIPTAFDCENIMHSVYDMLIKVAFVPGPVQWSLIHTLLFCGGFCGGY